MQGRALTSFWSKYSHVRTMNLVEIKTQVQKLIAQNHSIISILHRKDTKLLIIKRFPPYTLRKHKLTTNSYKIPAKLPHRFSNNNRFIMPTIFYCNITINYRDVVAYGFWLIDSKAFPSKHLKCWVGLETTKVINIELRAELSFKMVFLMQDIQWFLMEIRVLVNNQFDFNVHPKLVLSS